MAHVHEYETRNVGFGLERSVCAGCGHVSIRSVPRLTPGREEAVRQAFRALGHSPLEHAGS